MPIEKAPFRSYTPDWERDRPKRDVFSISLNEKERAILDRFKQDTNIPMDSKAFKVMAMIGANVSFTVFGTRILKYLSSQDRTKIID